MGLYATHGGFGATDTNLYTIDTGDMSGTLVGDTGHFFTGLAFDPTDPTKLYGVTGNLGADQQKLFLINPSTGGVTLIGSLGTTIADITFDASGQMYGWKVSTKRLVTIDKAIAAVVDVGASGVSSSTNGNGIAVDPNDDNIVWWFPQGNNGDIFNVNKTTGHATDMGLLFPHVSGSMQVGSASFGPSDVLYALGTDTPGTLFTIGPPDGFGQYPETLVGSMPSEEEPWDAMAWGPDSAPPIPPDLATLPGKYAVFHNGEWHIMVSNPLT